MTVKLASRLSKVKPSATLAVAARAAALSAQGKDIISLGAGEPDFDTPEYIKRAAFQAMQDGFTKYTPVEGLPSTKQAVIDKFKRENNLTYTQSQVIVSNGGKQAIYNLIAALIEEGDEVIIPAPYWVSYPDMVLLADGTPVIIETTIDENYKISPEQLEQAITPKTRLFIINSPSNPTGVAYTAKELKAIAEVLVRHPHVLVATDDMYEHIMWTDEAFTNIVNVCPELYDRTVVFNGVSKAYSMTGWRIGYAGGPADLINAMKKIQSQSTSNPCAIAQKAAEAALNGGLDSVKTMTQAFKERHDNVFQRLNAMDGVSVKPSDGTFYIFPNVQGLIDRIDGISNDVAFAEYLINEAGVALVPGAAFGTPGCVRLSYAIGMDVMNDALDRIARVCKI